MRKVMTPATAGSKDAMLYVRLPQSILDGAKEKLGRLGLTMSVVVQRAMFAAATGRSQEIMPALVIAVPDRRQLSLAGVK